ncbi:MAG: hypothetical protein M3457_15405 [Chloroflexota bacterium]|nr:hypothetical protein [Chloroflexota bacterium]
MSVRDNVGPLGAFDDQAWEPLAEAGATSITSQGTLLAKGYDDGRDLSGSLTILHGPRWRILL